MYALSQGLLFAYRQLRKTPWFTLILVLTLGLGIDGTTAIFSLVQGILLRPLPFSHPDHLVVVLQGLHLLRSQPPPSVPSTEGGTSYLFAGLASPRPTIESTNKPLTSASKSRPPIQRQTDGHIAGANDPVPGRAILKLTRRTKLRLVAPAALVVILATSVRTEVHLEHPT